MKVLELEGDSPRQWGRVHGEEYRHQIAELADIRTDLCVSIGAYRRDDEVYRAAAAHLALLERFDGDLYQELIGIAEGAGVSPERVVVLNHYTDLRDLHPEALDQPGEDDCSAVWTHVEGGSLLGQTWDMHGSAMPYVMMLGIPPRGDAPGAWVFTITGCVGMTGMNGAGIGITINNLKSTDAKVGVIWPALVRRVLRERGAEAARDVVLGAPLGSGHHYLVSGPERAFGIETSGSLREVVFDGDEGSYVHTNHCLAEEVAAVSTVSPESTTRVRYDWLSRSLAEHAIADRADLWRRLGSHDGYPRSICTHMASPTQPHAMLTCGALVMDLPARLLWAAAGCIHGARPHTFQL